MNAQRAQKKQRKQATKPNADLKKFIQQELKNLKLAHNKRPGLSYDQVANAYYKGEYKQLVDAPYRGIAELNALKQALADKVMSKYEPNFLRLPAYERA